MSKPPFAHRRRWISRAPTVPAHTQGVRARADSIAYLLAIYGFCAFAVITAVVDGVTGRHTHILYPLFGGAVAGCGIATFVGLAHSRNDALARIRSRKPRRARPRTLVSHRLRGTLIPDFVSRALSLC